MNKKKAGKPKAPAKGISVDPTKRKEDRELEEKDLDKVSGGRPPQAPGCTCSNMPLDPG